MVFPVFCDCRWFLNKRRRIDKSVTIKYCYGRLYYFLFFFFNFNFIHVEFSSFFWFLLCKCFQMVLFLPPKQILVPRSGFPMRVILIVELDF